MNLGRYRIDISQIATTAKNTAKHIAALVRGQKINPDNLVVLIGEYHTQLSHQYFEKKFVQNLHGDMGLSHLFVEGNIAQQEEVTKAETLRPHDRTWSAMMHKDSIHSFVHNVPMHYAFQKKIPVHLIDAEDEYDDEEEDYYVGNVLPPSFEEKYRKHKMVSAMIRKNKGQLFRENMVHHVSSNEGVMKRDLFMMDRIMDITAEKPGLSMAVVGEFHIANIEAPDQNTLSEMLHANGKDVVNIILHPTERVDGLAYSYNQYVRRGASASKKQQQRLASRPQRNTFATMDIDIAGSTRDDWTGLWQLCMQNREIPSVGLSVLAAAEKFSAMRQGMPKSRMG